MLQAQTGFATPYCIELPGSAAPPGKDWVQMHSYLCQAPAARAVLCSCPSLSLGCGTLSSSAEVNPPLLWDCLFNSFSANLVYIKPIWSETGLFRDVAGLSIQQPAPSWGKADMQKRKTCKQSQKTYSKSCDCFNIASKINTFGSCMMETGKWNKNK